jgi:hypothetical protein
MPSLLIEHNLEGKNASLAIDAPVKSNQKLLLSHSLHKRINS